MFYVLIIKSCLCIYKCIKVNASVAVVKPKFAFELKHFKCNYNQNKKLLQK